MASALHTQESRFIRWEGFEKQREKENITENEKKSLGSWQKIISIKEGRRLLVDSNKVR